MKRARFIAPARREFLSEVVYYNGKEPGLGTHFAAAIEDATTRAVAFPLTGSPASKNTCRVFVKNFPFAFVYRMQKASSSSRSHIIRVGQSIGSREFKIANKCLSRAFKATRGSNMTLGG